MIPRKELHTDVLVLGSGPAGFAAAYTAAKNGAKVILVEQGGDVGGISTSGLMSHWTGSCGSPLYWEILQRSADKNEGEHKGVITIFIDPEKLKTLYMEMLSQAQVQLMLYTFAFDTICDGDKVLGATVLNKSGQTDIYAKVTIDATGDGDIAARAGAEFVLGRESDNKMQPATLMFKVGGVDYSRAVFLGAFEDTYETEKGELQALGRQHIPYPAGHVLTMRTTLPGIVTCNMTNVLDIDGTNAEDLTRATLTCRQQMDDIVRFLREFVPGYENCFIVSSASLIGIRETRHFKGKYTITKDDIWQAKVKDADGNDLLSLTELAASKGMATAVMSTDTLTGATPAAFYAHAMDRADSEDITAYSEEKTENGTIITCNLDVDMSYQKKINDTLTELDKNENGFFIMYEEGHIDKHSHNHDLTNTFKSMIRFNQAIGLFMEYAFYHPDTFVLITADHETGGLTWDFAEGLGYTESGHTGAEVPIFAYGQGAEVFQNCWMQNNEIPKIIADLWGISNFGG